MKKLYYLIFIFLFLIFVPSLHAYTNNMSASVVLGHPDFTSSTANNGDLSSATLNGPRGIAVCNGKLVVAELSNNRVLIWNSIPSTSNVVADVVIGQPNFSSNTSNNGGISA